MPSIDEHGVGGCHHRFENGVCFFCGELEKGSADPALELLLDMGQFDKMLSEVKNK